MKICPHCQYRNLEGIMFCEDCGQSLLQVQSVGTRSLEFAEKSANLITSPQLDQAQVSGTARFNENTQLIIRLRDTPSEPLTLYPSQELTIGRYDGSSPTRPQLDLTPYDAYEKGVSRLHAAIRRGDHSLLLIDLNSANGTQLNGQRLRPHESHVLRDGDEVRLGNLVMHIFFKRQTDIFL